MLAGVQKWIYAGVIQHVYALGIVAKALGGVTAADDVLRQAFEAELYCYPVDHHDHWHVSFPLEASWLTDTKKLPAFVTLWKRLGVDLQPMIGLLEKRAMGGTSKVDADRRRLLEVLAAEPSDVPEGEPSGEELLAALGKAIASQTYPQSPPKPALKPLDRIRIEDWDWQVLDSDDQDVSGD
jgi:hypothetical protein